MTQHFFSQIHSTWSGRDRGGGRDDDGMGRADTGDWFAKERVPDSDRGGGFGRGDRDRDRDGGGFGRTNSFGGNRGGDDAGWRRSEGFGGGRGGERDDAGDQGPSSRPRLNLKPRTKPVENENKKGLQL